MLDKENRTIKQEVEALRAQRNKLSKQIGALMAKGEKEEAEKVKEILKYEMENAVKLSVPLIAEVSEANNWYDCK